MRVRLYYVEGHTCSPASGMRACVQACERTDAGAKGETPTQTHTDTDTQRVREKAKNREQTAKQRTKWKERELAKEKNRGKTGTEKRDRESARIAYPAQVVVEIGMPRPHRHRSTHSRRWGVGASMPQWSPGSGPRTYATRHMHTPHAHARGVRGECVCANTCRHRLAYASS